MLIIYVYINLSYFLPFDNACTQDCKAADAAKGIRKGDPTLVDLPSFQSGSVIVSRQF